MCFYNVIDLIKDIPATFWGVLAGSVFTLTGVYFTNKANDKRSLIQLEHDRKLRAVERDLIFRKEIYLAATEAIAEGMILIGNLSEINVPYKELSKRYLEKLPAISKVELIAKEPTLEALSKFRTQFSSALFRLIEKRTNLENLWKKQASIDERLKINFQERERLLQTQREDILAGNLDQRRNERLTSLFQNFGSAIDKDISEKNTVIEELKPKLHQFFLECGQEITTANTFIVPLVACVRAELDFPFDSAIYEKLVKESNESAINNLEQFMGRLFNQDKPNKP